MTSHITRRLNDMVHQHRTEIPVAPGRPVILDGVQLTPEELEKGKICLGQAPSGIRVADLHAGRCFLLYGIIPATAPLIPRSGSEQRPNGGKEAR